MHTHAFLTPNFRQVPQGTNPSVFLPSIGCASVVARRHPFASKKSRCYVFWALWAPLVCIVPNPAAREHGTRPSAIAEPEGVNSRAVSREIRRTWKTETRLAHSCTGSPGGQPSGVIALD